MGLEVASPEVRSGVREALTLRGAAAERETLAEPAAQNGVRLVRALAIVLAAVDDVCQAVLDVPLTVAVMNAAGCTGADRCCCCG